MFTFVGFLINQETKMKNKGGWCSPLLDCSDQNSAPCFGEPETRSWIFSRKRKIIAMMIRIQTKGKRLNDVDLSSALLPYLPYFLFHSSPNSEPTSDCDDVKHQQDSIVFGPPNPSALFLLYKPLFHSEHVGGAEGWK